MASKSLRGQGKQEERVDRPTIYVRRNGSRYIDTDELLQSAKFRKTVEKLKDVVLKPSERPND